jgi:hypothetical protein
MLKWTLLTTVGLAGGGGLRSPVGLATFVIASGIAFGLFTSRPLLARH